MSELSQRIARASRAQGVMSLGGKAVNLLATVALARLLFPEDYGLFTIALLVTGLANLVSHFGFQTYVIQAPELTDETLHTCYTLNLIFAIVLGGLVALIGLLWPATPGVLGQMLALYGVHVFLSGLSYIELALMKRELDFRRSARVELVSTTLAMGSRVGFAAAHFGALCFPLGDVIGSLARWLMVRGRGSASLRLTRPDAGASREALVFGMHSTSAGLASFVANQTDKLLVAANHPIGHVGLYSFAATTAAMFYNAFIVPQTSVFLATFARLREDPEGARRILTASSRLIFSYALPLNILLLLEPQRIIGVIFGAQWVASSTLVQIFAVDFIIRSIFSGITGLQMSLGRAAEAARTKWLNALVFVVFLLAATALRLDLAGYAIAYVGANLVATVHNLHVNGRLIQIRWGKYALNLLAPAAIALAATAAWFVTITYSGELPRWSSFAAALGAWLGTYLLLSLAFNRMMFTAVRAAFARDSLKSGQ